MRYSFFAGAVLLFANFGVVRAQGPDAEAADLLARARANGYSGDYSCEVSFVRDSYLRGADSLRGRMEFRDAEGERRLTLDGDAGFEWWSSGSGLEQWRRDAGTDRLRRIAPHSLKKPALCAVMTYEDLAKFPFGYLAGFRSCRKLAETDSTYELSLVPAGGIPTRYASLAVTLGKRPLLLRRIVFCGPQERPFKTLEIARYRPQEGKYLPTDFSMRSEDGLASLRGVFGAALPALPMPTDKTSSPGGRPPGAPASPQWEPADGPVDE